MAELADEAGQAEARAAAIAYLKQIESVCFNAHGGLPDRERRRANMAFAVMMLVNGGSELWDDMESANIGGCLGIGAMMGQANDEGAKIMVDAVHDGVRQAAELTQPPTKAVN